MGDWRVIRVRTTAEREEALGIRYEVFVDEQGVPVDREKDEYDEDAIHFVAYDSTQPVGVARLREYDDNVGKVERVAVRDEYRGEGWGRRIMATIETTALEEGFAGLRLDSQTDVIGFYERLGYDVVSKPFIDAGIRHRTMLKRLD
jgi:predicted GNAT family N-acyltransferase